MKILHSMRRPLNMGSFREDSVWDSAVTSWSSNLLDADNWPQIVLLSMGKVITALFEKKKEIH